jgi:hypothetical protein
MYILVVSMSVVRAQATIAVGVADSLSERIGGQPYPALQAAETPPR